MPNHHDIHKALEALLQVRSLLETSAGGSKDLPTLRRVRDLSTLATRAVVDSSFRNRLVLLENYADALFSDRKRQQWARNKASGVFALRHRAYAELDALERRLHYIQAARTLSTSTNQFGEEAGSDPNR
jgi:hypothetical protein